jgi:predicted metal-dependent phosphoesterase TrpH
MRYADLHLHTIHSDGTRSAREVIDLAAVHDLAIVAISDHDNVAAFAEIRDYAASRAITIIPAAELSAEEHGIDVHLLAYAFDPDDKPFMDRLAAFREARQRRGERMVQRLQSSGFDISLERVREIAADGALGRPHVARALVEIGAVSSINEAFSRLLVPGRPGFVPKERFKIAEAVRLVHSAGGVLSVAHPTLYPDFLRLTGDILDLGVDAVEVIHPEISPGNQRLLRELAQRRGAFVTGGSDDHGAAKKNETIGSVRISEDEIAPILSRLA